MRRVHVGGGLQAATSGRSGRGLLLDRPRRGTGNGLLHNQSRPGGFFGKGEDGARPQAAEDKHVQYRV